MVVMYKEQKDWDMHYKEWKRILPSIVGDDNGTKYRRKILERLINEYEVMNK
jgi:hypothetical protein|tara:strand:- start:864 stop:1019 length:156 start_codon:yes stop_codon:yes gene_type:complete